MSDASNRIVKHLLLLGAFLQREANRLLGDYGLNQQQFIVLKTIEEKGPLNQKNICSALLFEKSNVSKIIRKLEQDRLISITYPDNDARVSLLETTKKGNDVIERCMERLNEWNSTWVTALSDKEARQAVKILDKLTEKTG